MNTAQYIQSVIQKHAALGRKVNENRGPMFARMAAHCLRMASGDVLPFNGNIDDDDMMRRAIATMALAFMATPAQGGAFGLFMEIHQALDEGEITACANVLKTCSVMDGIMADIKSGKEPGILDAADLQNRIKTRGLDLKITPMEEASSCPTSK